MNFTTHRATILYIQTVSGDNYGWLNTGTLCRTHHRLVHEGGIGIQARAGGGWRFFRVDGREFEVLYGEPAPTYEWTALQETHAALGIHIDDDTAATRWGGERMDYELGVSVLCSQAERARHAGGTVADMGVSAADMGVSAETPG